MRKWRGSAAHFKAEAHVEPGERTARMRIIEARAMPHAS